MKNVIIIGSGLGGLTLGNLLSQKGHKVTIFESHSTPGGYTAGFYRNGYYFESGTVSLEASSTVFRVMKDIGVLDKIEFIKLSPRFVSENFDGIPENYDDYKKMIYSGFPYDKENLDLVFSDLDKIVKFMDATAAPMPFVCNKLEIIKSIFSFILNSPKLIKVIKKYADMTSSEFALKYFEKDSKLFNLFGKFGYPDMSAMMVGGAMSGLFTDLWTIKDGMQSWADVLAENFKELGGELKLNSYVDKIITKNGAAIGVSSKDILYDADVVISAGDYKKTLLNLLDNNDLISQKLKNNLEEHSVSQAFFTVYLGLNMSNTELEKYMKVPHVFDSDKSPNYDIYNSNDEEFFNKTSISLYSPSMINSKLAPEGKSSLMLMTTVPYHWMNNWGDGNKETYNLLKEKAMNTLIEKASKIIPSLKECMDYKDAATPITYERFTHNTDGASSSWNWNPKKKFYKDIMGVNIETPVKNLYIGSCWAMQIGGIPGALAAAYKCAKKIK